MQQELEKWKRARVQTYLRLTHAEKELLKIGPRKVLPKDVEIGMATTHSSVEKSIKEHVKRKMFSGIPVAPAQKKKTSKI